MPKRLGYSTISLEDGIKIFNNIKKKLTVPCYVAGSIRREVEKINDIDIIVTPGNKDITNTIKSIFYKIERFGTKLINGVYLFNNKKILVDIFISTKQELPYAFLQYTGPKSYNVRIRKYVKDKYNWKLNQYGLYYRNNINKKVNGSINLKTEKEINNFIGTTYYHPRDRK